VEAKRELNDQLSQSQQDRAAAVEANSGQGSNRRAPEKVFGYSCITEHSYQLRHRAQCDNSYMLRVVHRGCMNDQLTWYPGYADFVQHGQSVPSLPAIFSGRHLRGILRGEQFNFSKLPPAKNRASKSIADWFSLIEEITQLSAMQELFAWFRAGYIPVSMAAPLGAKECAATFNSIQHPITTAGVDDSRARRILGSQLWLSNDDYDAEFCEHGKKCYRSTAAWSAGELEYASTGRRSTAAWSAGAVEYASTRSRSTSAWSAGELEYASTGRRSTAAWSAGAVEYACTGSRSASACRAGAVEYASTGSRSTNKTQRRRRFCENVALQMIFLWKTRKVRPGRFSGGYMKATTQRNRSKFCSCDLEFNFTSELQDEHRLFSWKFNTRRNCKNTTLHTGHPRTGFAMMTHKMSPILFVVLPTISPCQVFYNSFANNSKFLSRDCETVSNKIYVYTSKKFACWTQLP
jgi:hypothetical protein